MSGRHAHDQPVEEFCGECGGTYPSGAKSEEGPWHSLSCSLHSETEGY